MEITNHLVGLYQAIQTAPIGKLKDLTQKERNLVLSSLKSISETKPIELTTTQKFQINQIRHKLHAPIEHFPNFIQQCLNGFLNLIHARISTKQIIREFENINRKINEFQKTPDRIQEDEAAIQILKESLEYQPKAVPYYKDIVSFLNQLPVRIEEVTSKLQEKIDEIEQKILPFVITETTNKNI